MHFSAILHLIDSMFSIENQVKGLTNKTKAPRKKCITNIGGNVHKTENLKNVEFSFWSYTDFKYTYVFVHPLANKSK